MGDSTIDNGYWVQRDRHYERKTRTVTYQTAVSLHKTSEKAYDIANFAVDGATTGDLLRQRYLDKVLREDPDHPHERVWQINAIESWQPEVVVLSVAGNNYRESLYCTIK